MQVLQDNLTLMKLNEQMRQFKEVKKKKDKENQMYRLGYKQPTNVEPPTALPEYLNQYLN